MFEVADFEHFDGLSGFVAGMDIPVVAVFKGDDLARKRFTVAHELGHLLLDFSEVEAKSTEKLCHAFAGALLLPANVMREELGGQRKKITEWELKKLKGIFGISMQAIMARALRLGIISEKMYKSFCIRASKLGWRKAEPGKYKGKEVANRFKQLVYYAAAEQIISFSRAAEFLNKSLAEFDREIDLETFFFDYKFRKVSNLIRFSFKVGQVVVDLLFTHHTHGNRYPADIADIIYRFMILFDETAAA